MNARKKLVVCVNRRGNPDQPSCAMRGGVELADLLEKSLLERGLKISLERFKCLGQCAFGPNLKLSPGGKFMHHAKIENIQQILSEIEDFEKS